MTGRITKRMNLDGVTLSPSPLLLSPLPSRCRSHTGEHNPTSDPHTAKRCKPLRHSANTQHKPQAPLTPSNWSALYRGRGSPVMSWILLKPWGVFIEAGQPLQHGEVRDTNLSEACGTNHVHISWDVLYMTTWTACDFTSACRDLSL